MSHFTYISFPRKINIECSISQGLTYREHQKNSFYPVVFGGTGNSFLDLCFSNKFRYTISIGIFLDIDYKESSNFDGFESDENYQGLVHNIIYPYDYLEHPKPYLLKFEKKIDNWIIIRKYFRNELYKVLNNILLDGEFVEIFSEVEKNKNSNRKYLEKAGPPMIEKTLHISELLKENSEENLTQHMMKVKIIKD
ncbi:MAG: hypothetical protein FWF57_00720 [Defluviitaleaceae bacterium]|nr:hypothetical protein [Defluviitaleaceae bacterium]